MQHIGHGGAWLLGGGVADECAEVLRSEAQSRLTETRRFSRSETLFNSRISLMTGDAIQFAEQEFSGKARWYRHSCWTNHGAAGLSAESRYATARNSDNEQQPEQHGPR